MITKIACSLDKELLVYNSKKRAWEFMDTDGQTRAFKPEPGPKSISEWNGTKFCTQRCVIPLRKGPFEKEMVVENASNPYINGTYHHILGGFKNEYNVWYIRSQAGQHVLGYRDGPNVKVLGVAEEKEPMVLDLSVTSSEIKTLFKKKYWALCKKLVWKLRMQNKPFQDSPFKVSVCEIPHANKGRKSRLFIPNT